MHVVAVGFLAGKEGAVVSPVQPPRPGLPPRWAIVRAVARSLLTVAVMLVIYYDLPVTGDFDGRALMVLLGGLVIFMILIGWQVREIVRADYPALRTIESMAAALPLLLLVFSTAYILMDNASKGAFSEPLSKTDAIYFAVTVFATVGFGDITPRTDLTRVVTTLQMIVDLLVLGLILRLLVRAAREGIERKTAGDPLADDRARPSP